jgi:DNA topoisomerase-1
MSDSDLDHETEFIDFANAETNEGWWEGDAAATKKGEQRWATLSHNGVLFPPPYQPHGVPIYYEGKEFQMTPEEEEVATMFAVLRENEYYRQETFRKNFFVSWLKILNKRGDHPIKRLEYVTFDAIWEWHLKEKEKRNTLSREEKKKVKAEQDKLALPFKYCLWDGKKEEVANYRVEPPGLFRGRGEHPLRGTLKRRVAPEDITINIDPSAPIPKCPPNHKWKGIAHDNTKTWLAMWEDNVTGERKYVMLAASSTVKGLSDREKFERARRLHQHIDKIREWYEAQWQDKNLTSRQLGVATYFIDKLALRVGNEKNEDEADTVGCCSLRVEHVRPEADNKLHFDFLGKDSIRYQNTVDVDPKVHGLVRQFVAGKQPREQLFDQVDPTELNHNFKRFMPDLTAKVFRTYNASKTLQDCFAENPLDPKTPLPDKMVYFTKANTRVAELCNHQKSVGKAHYKQMASMAVKESSLQATVERLRKAAKDLSKKGVDRIAEEFFAEQDNEQREWLEQYGTDDERKAFEEEITKRGEKKVRVKTDGTKSKKSAKTKSATKKKSKTSRKAKKTRTIDDVEDDDDDTPLAALIKIGDKDRDDDEVGDDAAGKKSVKAAKQKSTASKNDDEVSDDEAGKKPVKAAKQKSASKSKKPAKKAAVKKDQKTKGKKSPAKKPAAKKPATKKKSSPAKQPSKKVKGKK